MTELGNGRWWLECPVFVAIVAVSGPVFVLTEFVVGNSSYPNVLTLWAVYSAIVLVMGRISVADKRLNEPWEADE